MACRYRALSGEIGDDVAAGTLSQESTPADGAAAAADVEDTGPLLINPAPKRPGSGSGFSLGRLFGERKPPAKQLNRGGASAAPRIAFALDQGFSLQGLLQAYMNRLHIPVVMNRGVQLMVLFIFVTATFLSLALIPRLSVGLDQAVALPRDSYLQKYFQDIGQYLRVGPPLFLVVNNINVTEGSGQVDQLCSISGCKPDSLANRISEVG